MNAALSFSRCLTTLDIAHKNGRMGVQDESADQLAIRFTEVLSSDITAISDFLIRMEAEPFITPEKAENRKCVAFTSLQTT